VALSNQRLALAILVSPSANLQQRKKAKASPCICTEYLHPKHHKFAFSGGPNYWPRNAAVSCLRHSVTTQQEIHPFIRNTPPPAEILPLQNPKVLIEKRFLRAGRKRSLPTASLGDFLVLGRVMSGEGIPPRSFLLLCVLGRWNMNIPARVGLHCKNSRGTPTLLLHPRREANLETSVAGVIQRR